MGDVWYNSMEELLLAFAREMSDEPPVSSGARPNALGSPISSGVTESTMGNPSLASGFTRQWADKTLSRRLDSSFAGLFWFNDDYSDVLDLQGLVEFDSLDVAKKATVLPEGVHAQYRGKRYSTPRGRVELNNGIPTISVGTSCPDSAIHEVKKSMGLLHFPRVDVRRASFWDGKSTGDQ